PLPLAGGLPPLGRALPSPPLSGFQQTLRSLRHLRESRTQAHRAGTRPGLFRSFQAPSAHARIPVHPMPPQILLHSSPQQRSPRRPVPHRQLTTRASLAHLECGSPAGAGESARGGGAPAGHSPGDHVAGSDRLPRVLSSWTEAKQCYLYGDALKRGLVRIVTERLIRLPPPFWKGVRLSPHGPPCPKRWLVGSTK